MDTQKILNLTDHTLLRVGCTRDEIAQLCEDAVTYHCAAVSVAPCFVSFAKDCIGGRSNVKTGASVGFPNGYNTSEIKAAEAREAKENGAEEVDVVINISLVKDRNWEALRRELEMIREASEGITLKVIIETCLLTEEEKIRLCHLVTECKADYIKTSTGFSSGGATARDVELLKKNVGENVKVKAAGGIHTLEEAQALIDAGASRIGASGMIEAAKERGFFFMPP